MLTLTRKVGQKITIGDDIMIVVSHISGDKEVKLSIEAPRNIKILREELPVYEEEDDVCADPAQ